MKLKEYKKQLNESIEVIDVHDKVSEDIKSRTYSYEKQTKEKFNFKPLLRIGIAFCSFILLGTVIIIAINSNGSFSSNKSFEKENIPKESKNYSEYTENRISDASDPIEDPIEETGCYEPTGAYTPSESEIDKTELFNLYINIAQSNSINPKLDQETFMNVYSSFKNGESKDTFMSNNSKLEVYENEIEIIYNMVEGDK